MSLQRARVDADAETALASQHGAPPGKGYPSLWWVADGVWSEYRGGRTEADIVDLVLHRGGPLVTRLQLLGENATLTLRDPSGEMDAFAVQAVLQEHALRPQACVLSAAEALWQTRKTA